MVQAASEIPELTEDLQYNSRVTDTLVVMGTEDREAFDKVRAETSLKIIGTHSDSFHCDEVLATVLLLQTRQFADAMIVRTR